MKSFIIHLSIAFVLSGFVACPALAQQKVWLDKKGGWVSDSLQATHYALIDSEADHDMQVDIYTLGGRKCESIHYLAYGQDPKQRIKNGLYTKYHANGQVKATCTFKANRKTGESRMYYDNGQLEMLEYFQNGLRTGELIQYYPDGKLKREEIYLEGVCVKGKLYAEDGSKLEHQPWEARPEYPGGNEALVREIMKKARTSQDYRPEYRNCSIYLEFIVDKEGRVKNPTVKHDINPAVESMIIRALKSCTKRWRPGYKYGKPTDARSRIKINLI